MDFKWKEEYEYTYDNYKRLLKVIHRLNGGSSVILSENSYDEIGRLKSMQKGGNANFKANYTYNVRGWTKSISGTHFIENLDYTYSGNIKWMEWIQAGQKRKYDFAYDNFSQLIRANYTGIGAEKYATSYKYDKHGNMLNVTREGKVTAASYGIVDNLSFTYTGNQMVKAMDAVGTITLAESADFKDYTNQAVEYVFNANGAMTKDLNKGISNITYNSIDLPQRIDIKNPVAEARNEYTYTASGVKLRVINKWNPSYSSTPIIGSDVAVSSLKNIKTTDYVGNMIYENGNLKRILLDGGYFEAGSYHYYLTDHLGNNRVVVKADNSIIQRSHYYPFGMTFADKYDASNQPYKYNSKELNSEHGLNWYDYSARHYDGLRFTSVDPLAEKYYSWSPYAYVMNNPMRLIDPTGMWASSVDSLGNVTITKEKGDNGRSLSEFMKGYFSSDTQMLETAKLFETMDDKGRINLTKEVGGVFKDMTNIINNANYDLMNCWRWSFGIAEGKDPTKYNDDINDQSIANNYLNENYEDTSPIIGKTLVRFGSVESDNILMHAGIYMGKNKKGDVQVIGPTGWGAKPSIMTVKRLENKRMEVNTNPSYAAWGRFRGASLSHSGYYKYK